MIEVKVHPLQWDWIMSLPGVIAAVVSGVPGAVATVDGVDPPGIRFTFTKEAERCPFCGSHNKDFLWPKPDEG
jgi:hypothetical protein